ncbi:MAG: sterol desaturase [Rhodospirillaceae bacterium]|nr:sterol desaturase [Rhodospirillaceae bacterium]
MKNYIINNHNEIRIIFFIFFLLFFVLLEKLYPKKNNINIISIRYINNFILFFLNTILIKFLLPLMVIIFSIYTENSNFGLFNILNINIFISLIISLILFDLTIYLQHYLFHKITIFWKFHRVHHADTDLDVSTGLRFHPVEILISMFIKLIFISIIGPPMIAVLIFEIILNTSSMFNHSNINIPDRIDFFIRKLIITPNMHRIHHSNKSKNQNKNFGFNLSIWDNIFRTYKFYDNNKLDKLTIGVREFKSKNQLWVHRILVQPFK